MTEKESDYLPSSPAKKGFWSFWRFSSMDRPVQIMLVIGVLLLVGYGFALYWNWTQFLEHLDEIRLRLYGPGGLWVEDGQDLFAGIRNFLSALFLIPAFLLIGSALIMHVKETRRPK